MGTLHAIRGPLTATAALLRARWDAGDAVVVLPADASPGATASALEVLRPDVLTDVDDDGRTRSRALSDPAGVDDDVALVVATSGSTGRPKGVELTHAALAASTRASLARLGCRPGQRWALHLPVHHVAGVQVLLRSWALGTDAEVVAPGALERSAAQHVSLVPTQLRRALDAGVDLTRFATVLLGGAAADPALLERARAAGVRVVVSYGMSETCGGCVYDGRPLDGVDVEVAGGRIRIRGPVLLHGYRGVDAGTPAAVDGDGWFTTGDLGRWVDGRLEVLGRADGVVVTGGENVPTDAVTSALLTLPAIADAAVVGRPDPEWGHRVVAIVVARDPAAAPTLAQVRDHVRARLPVSHAPRELVVVDAIPRDRMGKLPASWTDTVGPARATAIVPTDDADPRGAGPR